MPCRSRKRPDRCHAYLYLRLCSFHKKLLDDGIITATICQQPYKQGYLPVELLSRYLIEGISCEEFHYTDIDIRIKENL